jgi:hypothetical protein
MNDDLAIDFVIDDMAIGESDRASHDRIRSIDASIRYDYLAFIDRHIDREVIDPQIIDSFTPRACGRAPAARLGGGTARR